MALGDQTMLFVRPDEMRVFTVTGTVDDDYEAQWLCDLRPNRPVRAAAGSPASLSLALTCPAGEVGILVVGQHNLIVPVTIGGDVTATITPEATRPPNDIPLNPFALVDPAVTVDALTFDVDGNDETPVIGEFIAGTVREVTPVRIEDAQFEELDFAEPRAMAAMFLPPYDEGLEGRTLKGTQIYTSADLAILRGWWQAQRAGTKPSVLIPNPDVNDAWLVQFQGLQYRPLVQPSPIAGSPASDQGLWLVTLTFVEYPRSRW